MPQIRSRRLRHLPAELTVPGDKSISHRAVMFAGLCDGTSIIRNFLPSDDCIASMNAMKALGADVEILETNEDGRPMTLSVTGHGLNLAAPSAPIDCGNSGTTIRLLSGILAAQPFEAVLTGDASLTKRPMKRIADPLRLMGAQLEGHEENVFAPLTIRGGELHPIAYPLPMASAQVKSAVLLAGLQTHGKTTVIEPALTRDHTERVLSHFGVRTVRSGLSISIPSRQQPEANDLVVPGDISSAAFWMVTAAANPGSEVTIRNVGLNPTRTGVIKVLLRMGAHLSEIIEHGEGEPCGSVIVHGSDLNATIIEGDEIPNVIDELPILAVAAALARGETIIRDARELRVKETDRIHAVAHNLRQMGVPVDEFDDGMAITGGAALHGAELHSFGDHRIAMAFAVAGLFAEGVTTIDDTECISTSYPGFERHLNLFLNEPKHVEKSVPVSRIPRSVGIA